MCYIQKSDQQLSNISIMVSFFFVFLKIRISPKPTRKLFPPSCLRGGVQTPSVEVFDWIHHRWQQMGKHMGETKTGRVFLPQKNSSYRPIWANSISICKPWIKRAGYIYRSMDGWWFMVNFRVGIYNYDEICNKKNMDPMGLWIRFHLNFLCPKFGENSTYWTSGGDY